MQIHIGSEGNSIHVHLYCLMERVGIVYEYLQDAASKCTYKRSAWIKNF